MEYCVTTYNTGKGVGKKSLPQVTNLNYCMGPSDTLSNIYYKLLLLLLLLLLLCIAVNDYELSAIDADRRSMLKKLGKNPAQSMRVCQHSSMSSYGHTALPTNSHFPQQSPPPPIMSLSKLHSKHIPS